MPIALPNTPLIPATKPSPEPELVVQAFSYDERKTVMPALNAALESCGCWVLECKPMSLTQTRVRFEVQLRSVLELYSGLIAAGLELTRGSHLGLTGLCTVRKHQRRPREPFRLIEMVVEVSFLEELNLAACLLPGAAEA